MNPHQVASHLTSRIHEDGKCSSISSCFVLCFCHQSRVILCAGYPLLPRESWLLYSKEESDGKAHETRNEILDEKTHHLWSLNQRI